jgi:hypothetical protein
MLKKEVFVTYSWESEEFNNKVLSFTNFLRKSGYNAVIDKFISQEETAPDFNRMMHLAMTEYEKVIIVLSKNYKQKAESFSGGVGTEYNLIIKDIESSKQKYILVSFEEISDEIFPLSLKGREVIDLRFEKNLNTLFAKLANENIIEFSEVASQRPIITKQRPIAFENTKTDFVSFDLKYRFGGSRSIGQQRIDEIFNLDLEITNLSGRMINNFSIEIDYPSKSIIIDAETTEFVSNRKVSKEINHRLYPHMTSTFPLEHFSITNHNVKDVLNEKIIIKIYSEFGMVEKEFIVQESLLVVDRFNKKIKITPEMFEEKQW